MSPAAPAALARSRTREDLVARTAPVDLEEGLRVGLDDFLDGLDFRRSSARSRCPAPAAARATATSPSGCTACTPVGEMSTGIEIGWPITVVAKSRSAADRRRARREAQLGERTEVVGA